jgi:anti-sigma-K factor RskA
MSTPRPGNGHARLSDGLGSYVLGAMPDAERSAFERHLMECEVCRDDLASFKVVAEALPIAVAPLAPAPELKSRIMAVVRSEADLLEAAGERADVVPEERRERRRWRIGGLTVRPAFAALAAAVLLAIGGVSGALIADDGGAPSSKTYEASFTRNAPRASGSLVVTDNNATLSVAGMPQAPRGRVWEVWIQRGDKFEPTPALFTVNRDGRAVVAVPPRLSGAQAVLITAERRGGVQQPTQKPTVTIPLTTS